MQRIADLWVDIAAQEQAIGLAVQAEEDPPVRGDVAARQHFLVDFWVLILVVPLVAVVRSSRMCLQG